MNITTSTSSSEVNTTVQTKTNSSPTKTSDKSFDEEMLAQTTPTEESLEPSNEDLTSSTEQKQVASDKNQTDITQNQNQNDLNQPNINPLGNLINGIVIENKVVENNANSLTINQNLLQEDIKLNSTIKVEGLINESQKALVNNNSMKELLDPQALMQNNEILTQNIQDLIQTKDLINTVASAKPVKEYDTINMSEDDAEFFINLVQNTDMSMQSIATQTTELLMENSEGVQKSIKVSSVLMEKLSESIKTNQPFRIDFDKDISVIIKVNKDGSLSANFIPGDKAVEQYLKNNIGFLKQRFDDENLSYSELSYSNHKNQQEQKRKKENDNE